MVQCQHCQGRGFVIWWCAEETISVRCTACGGSGAVLPTSDGRRDEWCWEEWIDTGGEG